MAIEIDLEECRSNIEPGAGGVIDDAGLSEDVLRIGELASPASAGFRAWPHAEGQVTLEIGPARNGSNGAVQLTAVEGISC